MDAREKRLSDNESLFRQVNERLVDLNAALEVDPHRLEFLCECGDAACAAKIELSRQEYERVRSDPATFVVLSGHELYDIETIVDRGDGYVIVRKREGGPAERVAADDPRS
jgi:hypothetical protein